MLGTFIDTLVICTMTALVIITTEAHTVMDSAGNGSAVQNRRSQPSTADSRQRFRRHRGADCVRVHHDPWLELLRRALYELSVRRSRRAALPSVLGGHGGVRIRCRTGGALWGVADTLNGLMALPNLVALLLLSGTVFRLSKSYNFRS